MAKSYEKGVARRAMDPFAPPRGKPGRRQKYDGPHKRRVAPKEPAAPAVANALPWATRARLMAGR